MQDHIPLHGHLPVSDGAADPAQQLQAVLGGVVLPPRQIHMRAGLLNVTGDHPGYGRDVTVPGPLSLLRVAVLTSPLENGERPGIDLRITEDGLIGA